MKRKLHLITNKTHTHFEIRINHSSSWKLIRPHFNDIFAYTIFPLLCYSAEDDQLWHDDPYEYIRMKFGKKQNYSQNNYFYNVITYSIRYYYIFLCRHI